MLGFPKKKKIAPKITYKPKMLTSLEIDDKEEEFESERQGSNDSNEPGLAVIVHQGNDKNVAPTAETTLRKKTSQEPQKWSCDEGDVAMCPGVFSGLIIRTPSPPSSCRCSPEKDLVVEDFE